jgi:hypothetical protein
MDDIDVPRWRSDWQHIHLPDESDDHPGWFRFRRIRGNRQRLSVNIHPRAFGLLAVYRWRHEPALGPTLAKIARAVSSSPTFATWATTNAGGQAANLDWDNDGVPNGVEFFMNAAPGLTVNSGPVGSMVTWIHGGNIPSSAYGTAFVVQSSVDLVTWTDISGNDSNLVNTSNGVAYTFPVSGVGKQFIRLKLTLN